MMSLRKDIKTSPSPSLTFYFQFNRYLLSTQYIYIKHFASFYGGYKKKQAVNSFLALWIKFKILTNSEPITLVSGLFHFLSLPVSVRAFIQQTLGRSASVHSTATQPSGAYVAGDIWCFSFYLALCHNYIFFYMMEQKLSLYIPTPPHLCFPHCEHLFFNCWVRRLDVLKSHSS